VEFRNYALDPDVLTTLAYCGAFFAPTFDFAFAAVQACRLFDIHSLDFFYVTRCYTIVLPAGLEAAGMA
jgi:hypothetical protein